MALTLLVQNHPAPGTYSFRMNVSVGDLDGGRTVNIPVDAVIKRLSAKDGDFPLLVEAKSAGDFTNTNKRRKEEAQKKLRRSLNAIPPMVRASSL